MRLIIQISIVCICVALLAVILWRNRRTLSPESRIEHLIAILLCLASLLPGLIPESPNPDYIDIARPNLEPQLVIDTYPGNQFEYSFIIQNIGRLTAKNIDFLHKTDQFTMYDNFSQLRPRELASGAKMSVDAQLIPLDIPKDGTPLFIRLWCTYSGIIKGQQHDIVSQFTFSVPINALNQHTFSYERVMHTRG